MSPIQISVFRFTVIRRYSILLPVSKTTTKTLDRLTSGIVLLLLAGALAYLLFLFFNGILGPLPRGGNGPHIPPPDKPSFWE
jgi:hypothetical protein